MRPPNDLEFHKGSIYFVMAGADGVSVRAGSVHRTERHDRLQVEIMAEAPTGEKDVMGFMIVQKIGGKWKVVDLSSP